MKKTILLATVLMISAGSAHAANYCSSNSIESCPKVAGCAWKDGDVWTSASGKTRTVAAGCKFNAKLAREALSVTAGAAR